MSPAPDAREVYVFSSADLHHAMHVPTRGEERVGPAAEDQGDDAAAHDAGVRRRRAETHAVHQERAACYDRQLHVGRAGSSGGSGVVPVAAKAVPGAELVIPVYAHLRLGCRLCERRCSARSVSTGKTRLASAVQAVRTMGPSLSRSHLCLWHRSGAAASPTAAAPVQYPIVHVTSRWRQLQRRQSQIYHEDVYEYEEEEYVSEEEEPQKEAPPMVFSTPKTLRFRSLRPYTCLQESPTMQYYHALALFEVTGDNARERPALPPLCSLLLSFSFSLPSSPLPVTTQGVSPLACDTLLKVGALRRLRQASVGGRRHLGANGHQHVLDAVVAVPAAQRRQSSRVHAARLGVHAAHVDAAREVHLRRHVGVLVAAVDPQAVDAAVVARLQQQQRQLPP
ncbi:hypothetical protein ON010_g985 [Phytophthora cinnamomi]|nr:hypothetical protein ON010_g985 [Phytophthora cinnamomi]